MSMSVGIYAMRDSDRARTLAAIYHRCVEAGIEPPDEGLEYFGRVAPKDDCGVERLPSSAVTQFSDSESACDYYEIDMEQVPKGTRRLRVRISF